MKVATILTTLLAGAGLATASRCRPSAPSSVSSSLSSSSSSSASPSPSTAPGCTFDSTVNLMAGQLDASGSSWQLTSGSQYGSSYYTTTCPDGPTNDCIVYSAASSAGASGYDIEFSFDLASTVAGATYVFSFEVSQDTDVSNTVSLYTGNTFAFASYTLNTANTVQTAELQVTAVADTNFIVSVDPADPTTTFTFDNFAVYQVAC